MAQIFSTTIGGERLLSIWYHFAIMFEALFILTVLDAGTRVGALHGQDLGGRVWKPFGRTGWMPGILPVQRHHRALVAIFFIKALSIRWAESIRSGRSLGYLESMLAAVALVVATTILMKNGPGSGWIWVTLLPMAWLRSHHHGPRVIRKIFDANPRIGFSCVRQCLAAQIVAGKNSSEKIAETQRLFFNQRLDAAVTGVLAAMILVLIVEALVQWYSILSRRKEACAS